MRIRLVNFVSVW